jgi:hypothetical protein
MFTFCMYLGREMFEDFSVTYLVTLAQAKMVRLHFLRVSTLPRFSMLITFKLVLSAIFSALLPRLRLVVCHCKIYSVWGMLVKICRLPTLELMNKMIKINYKTKLSRVRAREIMGFGWVHLGVGCKNSFMWNQALCYSILHHHKIILKLDHSWL